MSPNSVRVALASLLFVLVSNVASVYGQAGTRGNEWRTYGGDLGSTRYVPHDQINAENFGRLRVAWRFKTDVFGLRPDYNLQTTPLMVNGVIYSTAGTRRAVVALDAQTGEMIWMHSENEGARGAAAPRQLSGRGLAYWTDGREQRVLYVTPGYRLIALDARTGARISSFGKDGIVDLKENNDQYIDPLSSDIGLHATPVVAKDVVIVGAAHKSGGVPASRKNVKGYVRGFDVRTGKRLWIFDPIPSKGQPGYNTWLDGSAERNGNAGSWAQMSADPELGLVYFGIELPTGDWYGGNRPGAGLFGKSPRKTLQRGTPSAMSSSPHANRLPASPPRAAHSHSASLGRRAPAHAQYALASCHETCTTG